LPEVETKFINAVFNIGYKLDVDDVVDKLQISCLYSSSNNNVIILSNVC